MTGPQHHAESGAMGTDQRAEPAESIAVPIYLIRGKKVVLARDLANLYGVPAHTLSQTVKHHIDRFPEDFAFQLTRGEFSALMSQIAATKPGCERRGNLPWAFTEQGADMLAIVRSGRRTAQVNRMIDWHTGATDRQSGTRCHRQE